MNNDFKVLLTDDSDSAVDRLIGELTCINAEVFVCGKNGVELLKMFEEIQPDVIIADAFLQHIDAMGVLSRINTVDPLKRPIVTVMTCIENANFERSLIKNGADYIFIKPIDPKLTVERILQMLKWKGFTVFGRKNTDLNSEITTALYKIGVPANTTGCKYVKEAIYLAIKNPELRNSVIKGLYPAVAKKFKSSPANVERAIRYSISSAWNSENEHERYAYFGNTVKLKEKKPSNSKFIAMVSDRILVDINTAQWGDESGETVNY